MPFCIVVRESDVHLPGEFHKCVIRLLAADVGGSPQCDVPFGVYPDVGEVPAIGTSVIEQGIGRPIYLEFAPAERVFAV